MNSSHQEENNQNTLPSDYTELDLAKIREFMYKSTILLSYNSAILEEHQRKCEENENFLEAEAARDRIGEFKKIEEAKLKIETSKEFEKQRKLLEQEQNEELGLFNKKFDQEYALLNEAFAKQEVQMIQRHEEEMIQFNQEFEALWQKKKPKPSSEILNWFKIKETSIKQKEYQKAHDANVKIEELASIDQKRYIEEMERNRDAENQKLLKRQESELNGFMLKKTSVFVTFNKTKETNIDNLNRKYKSRLNELDNYQRLELSNFNKILKGLSKPNTRIQSIMKSASSYKTELSS